MLSAWTQLGECSLGCGGGTVTWVRTVETPASHGGEQCGDTRAELRQCNEDCNSFSGYTIIVAAAGGGVSLITIIIIIVLCIKRRRDKEIIEENTKRMVEMKQKMDEEKQKRDTNGGEYNDMDYPVQYD